MPAFLRFRARAFPFALGLRSRCWPIRENGDDAFAEELSPVRPTYRYWPFGD